MEREHLGGDCLNVGCVPSKALLRAARAVADVRDAGQYGIEVPPGTRVNFPAVMERMRRLRSEISRHDSAQRYRDELGVDVFLGEGRFVDSDSVEVDGRHLRFRRAVIATGARAMPLPIPGLAEAGYLTNETVFSLTELPERLAIIGAGPLGCELAQAFARFGSQVTLLEVMPHVLIREDKDAAALIRAALIRDGVSLVLGCQITGVERDGQDTVLRVEKDGQQEEVRVDAVLLGVGRAPNVEGLNLEAVEVEFDTKQGVKVDDRLQTTNSRIYAAGDICSPYKFTHMADALARIVIQNTLFVGRAKASALTVPWCTYTDPEIAHVGLYEHEAEQQGLAIQTFRQEMGQVDRAVLEGDTDGFVKIHTKAGADTILGATIVTRHAGEMISELTLAMVGGLGLGTLARTIHTYPTQGRSHKTRRRRL